MSAARKPADAPVERRVLDGLEKMDEHLLYAQTYLFLLSPDNIEAIDELAPPTSDASDPRCSAQVTYALQRALGAELEGIAAPQTDLWQQQAKGGEA